MMRKILLAFLILFFSMSLFKGVNFALETKKEEPQAIEKIFKKGVTKIEYVGHQTKRDPFGLPEDLAQYLAKPKVKIEDRIALPIVNLQGIIWSEKMPQVIINKQVMKVGDKIDQFEIREINKKGIILFYKEMTIPIEMPIYQRDNKNR